MLRSWWKGISSHRDKLKTLKTTLPQRSKHRPIWFREGWTMNEVPRNWEIPHSGLRESSSRHDRWAEMRGSYDLATTPSAARLKLACLGTRAYFSAGGRKPLFQIAPGRLTLPLKQVSINCLSRSLSPHCLRDKAPFFPEGDCDIKHNQDNQKRTVIPGRSREAGQSMVLLTPGPGWFVVVRAV